LAAHRFSDRLAVAIVQDERDRTYPVPLVVTDTELRRAAAGDGASEALIKLLAGGNRVLGDFQATSWHHSAVTGERAITVDQTNESLVVGEQAVVKWTSLADEGPHPAPLLFAELDRGGFTGMPQPWGTVQWLSQDDTAPRLVATVAEFVPAAEDGWTWAVDDIRAAVVGGTPDRVEATGRDVGELVASFHRALAHTARPDAPGEPWGWRSGAERDVDRALAVTTGRARELLIEHEAAVRSAFATLPTKSALVMKVHGDLHVGQLLRSQTAGSLEYLLTDFDGNPVVPAAERICEQPAAIDVAGMAQSFLHAGLVVTRHNPSLNADRVVETALAARAAFLEAYRSSMGQHNGLLDERLLRPFALRQVCREFVYAATHLPRWSYVPEQALPLTLDEGNL
jgi:maltokinase